MAYSLKLNMDPFQTEVEQLLNKLENEVWNCGRDYPRIESFAKKRIALLSNESQAELAFLSLEKLLRDPDLMDHSLLSNLYRIGALWLYCIKECIGHRTDLSQVYLQKSLIKFRQLDARHHIRIDTLIFYFNEYIKQFGVDEFLIEIFEDIEAIDPGHYQEEIGKFVVELRVLRSKVIREHFFDPTDLMGRKLTAEWSEISDGLKEAMESCWAEKYRSAPTKSWLKKIQTKIPEKLSARNEDAKYLANLLTFLADNGAALVRQIHAGEKRGPDSTPDSRASSYGASLYVYTSNPGDSYILAENEVALSYLIWYSALLESEELYRSIAELGLASLSKIKWKGNLSNRNGSAAMLAFTMMPPKVGVIQLLKVRKKTRNKNVLKIVEKHLLNMAAGMNLTEDGMLELSCPDFDLKDGITHQDFGDFIAIINVADIRKPSLQWQSKKTEKRTKSVPKTVKENNAAELKYLKSQVKEMTATFAVHRERLESTWVNHVSWGFADWQTKYIQHPLLSRFSSLLIWFFDEKETAIFREGDWINEAGKKVRLEGIQSVKLWHPIYSDVDLVQQWRSFLMERELLQPFKQAFREIYVLTDAERETGDYSNRFAAHVLNQFQFSALAKARRWNYNLQGSFDGHNTPNRIIKSTGIQVEFYLENMDVETTSSGIYEYIATDQVRFHKDGERLDLELVDSLTFSELMRDVDLFVGVASLGNNPEWQDGDHADYWHSYSFGELSATAQSRMLVLESILPKLKIRKQCRLEKKFLVVEGTLRTYKIHVGSGNILMEPNDEYLCIVPGAGKLRSNVFLPFEGDRTLSIILSKAMMLAADDKIKDRSILSQIQKA